MAARIQIVLDCVDAEALADFWAAALGYRRYGSANQYRSLLPIDGDGPKLILQQVAEPKAGKNRMHVDVHADDIEAEVARLETLGAVRIGHTVHEVGTSWIVMNDPEGNEFCIVAG